MGVSAGVEVFYGVKMDFEDFEKDSRLPCSCGNLFTTTYCASCGEPQKFEENLDFTDIHPEIERLHQKFQKNHSYWDRSESIDLEGEIGIHPVQSYNRITSFVLGVLVLHPGYEYGDCLYTIKGLEKAQDLVRAFLRRLDIQEYNPALFVNQYWG